MRSCVYMSIIIVAFIPAVMHAAISEKDAWSNAADFPISYDGTVTNPYESPVIGNGDLAASAQILSHELALTLGKNDVWDARISSLFEDGVLKHDDLVAANGEGDGLHDQSLLQSTDFVGKSKLGPTPKPVGFIRLRHPGLSDTKVRSEVDISRGMLTVEYGFHGGFLLIETFIHREKNVVLMRLSARGRIPWFSIVLEKMPDYTDPGMPHPVVCKGPGDNTWAVSQTIPAQYGVPDFSWHMAAVFPERSMGGRPARVIEWPYALQQNMTLDDGESVILAVGVATNRDGAGDSMERAFRLAGEADPGRFAEELVSHEEAWKSFWSASAIAMEDKELEGLWYRALFGFACHLRPGAQAPGLNANIPIYDHSAWNGFYTWNHNVEKWYFPALPVNHPEWYEVFADLIEQHIPVFEHIAKVTFGLDGVYCDLMTAPFAPPERAKTHSINGRALAHTGWLAAMLYQHYEFTGDAGWLRNRAYPYLKKAAEFYSNYLDKYQKTDGDIYPSMLLEDTHRWSRDFLRSRNVLTDLVMFKKAFEAAAAASEVLGVDSYLRERWRENIKRVPPVDYGWKDDRGWFAIYKDWDVAWPDFDEYLEHLRHSRWGCSGWLVFPGEHIQGDEEGGLAAAVRDVLRPTDLLNLPDVTRQLGTFHGEANFLPFIRMGMWEKFGALRELLLRHRFAGGQFSPYATGEGVYIRAAHTASWRIVENQYFPILGIAEMLLQSQGGVIRLFPFWPENKSASFRGMRARGGFIVSAEYISPGKFEAAIYSLCGNTCRLRLRGEGKPSITHNDQTVEYILDGRDIVFETKSGTKYNVIIE